MEKKNRWELKIKSTPLLKKKCSHCNSDRFYCSDKFRMNAQKKSIDVWLIYRCTKCDNTCNLTILSRTKPELIESTLFEKFSENETKAAWQYAFSAELARKNKVEFDYDSVEYEILNEVSIEDILTGKDETTTIEIKSEFQFNLKLSSLIRTCLNLSAGQFKSLVAKEAITIPTDYSIKSHKVKDGDLVLIHRDKFLEYLKKEE